MNPDKLLDNYIKDIDRELVGLSSRERQEITTEIRTHLVEKWQESQEGEVGMLNILEEFGDPRDIAREYIPTKSRSGAGSPPVWLVVVLTVFIWPVGIVLAWISCQWRTKHKVIATLIPLVLLVLVIGVMIPAGITYHNVATENVRIIEGTDQFPGDIPYIRPDGTLGWSNPGYEIVDQSGPVHWVQVLGTILSMVLVFLFFSSSLISGLYLAVTKLG